MVQKSLKLMSLSVMLFESKLAPFNVKKLIVVNCSRQTRPLDRAAPSLGYPLPLSMACRLHSHSPVCGADLVAQQCSASQQDQLH